MLNYLNLKVFKTCCNGVKKPFKSYVVCSSFGSVQIIIIIIIIMVKVVKVQNHQTSICKVSTGGGATYAALIIDRLELVGATVGLMFVDHLIMFVSKKNIPTCNTFDPPLPL
ncbi:hypothetical protein HanHA300_Chr03g0102091 [Helianthus annuus]|nr:hypothetical protein HanHA300_Chr03g0102091 [Helianthus annuus]KAJ0768915.1 hypothetical protein HanLR1_Chr03g0107101 [Helianthus annuus]